jgi:hypothetical protein
MSSPIRRRSIFQHAGNRVVQINHARADGLAAGEGEQLAGQVGGALGRFQNFLQVFAQRAGRRLVQGERGIAHDGLQHVVEVVRDTAREPAHRFHFLGLLQLALQPRLFLFRLDALRHIASDGDQRLPLSVRFKQRELAHFVDALLVVRSPHHLGVDVGSRAAPGRLVAEFARLVHGAVGRPGLRQFRLRPPPPLVLVEMKEIGGGFVDDSPAALSHP